MRTLALCIAAASLTHMARADAAASSASSPAVARPHMVLFLSDDHGWHFSGAYGHPAVRTPNLDRLAREGTRFTRAFAASPTCTPSRAALYTGRYPARNGAMGNHTPCRAGLKTLPAHLRALGYRVVLANKVHVRPRALFDFELLPGGALPPDPTFDRRYRGEGLDTEAVDRFLAAHARERPRQPLCLVLAESAPHVLWERNRAFDPATLPLTPILVDTHETRVALANYFQDIATMDDRLGRVLDALQRHGFAPDTLFLYTSDNGAEWPRSKWTLYDTGIRMPLVVRWPGRVPAGAVCDALISFVDILPTFIDVAGGRPPPDLDGRSFREVLLDPTRTFRDRIFASHTGDGDMNRFPQRCVRDTRYKYILNLHPDRIWTTHFTRVEGIPESHATVWNSWVAKAGTDAATRRLVSAIERHPAEELYDTERDPWELRNLAGDPALRPVLEAMRAELRRWMTTQGDPAAPRVSPPL